MNAPHFDAAVEALTAALGSRLAPGISDFVDLFEPDATIDVPFDGTIGCAYGRSGCAADDG